MGFSKYSSKRSSRRGQTLTITSQSMGYTNNSLTGPLEEKKNICILFLASLLCFSIHVIIKLVQYKTKIFELGKALINLIAGGILELMISLNCLSHLDLLDTYSKVHADWYRTARVHLRVRGGCSFG